jgi:hypothetical protein
MGWDARSLRQEAKKKLLVKALSIGKAATTKKFEDNSKYQQRMFCLSRPEISNRVSAI